jgi:hypothetical protein
MLISKPDHAGSMTPQVRIFFHKAQLLIKAVVNNQEETTSNTVSKLNYK